MVNIQALLSGEQWNNSRLTYSFFDGGPYYGSETGLSEVSDAIKENVRYILERVIEPLINVDFVEVSDAGDNYGQLRYLLSQNSAYGYAYSPSEYFDFGGDVHLNPNYDNDSYGGFQRGVGSYGVQALIHETLHALGLEHPGNYGNSDDPPFLPPGEDNNTNTVMTYNTVDSNAATPMPYDIAALQHLYGARTYNAGNNTYAFSTVHSYTANGVSWGNSATPLKQTIWDSGGLDTLNFSALALDSSGYRFDLNPGGLITSQSEYNASTYTAEGDSSGTTYRTSAYGTAIAFDCVIENLINSSSNDYILANSAANTFSGYRPGLAAGNDTIVGANTYDTLNLSTYSPTSVTQRQSGNNLILSLGSSGSVTVQNYFGIAAENRINIHFSATSGIDTVRSGVSYILGANLENLTLTGTNAINGTGNALNNRLTGNAASNTLNGGAGSDTLAGGGGNDIYVVERATDLVSEAVNAGTDIVQSSVSWTLAANLENLTLTGNAATNGTGNALNNIITGNAANNTLSGADGRDTLLGMNGNDIFRGGGGNDILTGGSGSDRFLYNTNAGFTTSAVGIDTITDFIRGTDKIILDKTTFTAISSAAGTGFSRANEFAIVGSDAAAATSGADIIYNSAAGKLFYNQNGAASGFGTGGQFALFSGLPSITGTDFLIQA